LGSIIYRWDFVFKFFAGQFLNGTILRRCAIFCAVQPCGLLLACFARIWCTIKAMVQDQLVDYVSSQVKLGVSRDTIKSALVSAGWISADVEDTLKKVASSPVAVKTAQSVAPSFGKTGSESQVIRVSDLVSGSPAVSASAIMQAKIPPKDPSVQFGGKISGNTFQATTPVVAVKKTVSGGAGVSSKKGLIGTIVAVVLILCFAGAAWYFYSANAGLAAKVASLTSDSASVNSQLALLQSQINSSSTGFASQIASLTAANSDLALDLSFYAVPIGSPSSTTGASVPVTISGSLSFSNRALYMIVTPRGAKIFIANSGDTKIVSQLKPLIGDTVQLAGTYVPGTDQMTVASVTDLSPAPPAPMAATSTASSTASSTTP